MSVEKQFIDNTLTTYMYEPFSYTISNPNPELYTLSTTQSSGLPASYITNLGDSILFETASNGMITGPQFLTINALDGSNVVATSTNTVNVQPGRFLDSNGNSFIGSNFTFYAKEAITPIKMVAPFNVGQPTSTPSLPPGLGFSVVDGSNVYITGTPPLPSPQSSNLIIAKAVGSSKVVSSYIPMVVNAERIETSVSPDSFVSGMSVGTAITPRTLTSRGNGVIRYTWNPFPDGIVAKDISGNVVSSPFIPVGTDLSYTLIISGTPTLAAATAFKNAGITFSGLSQSILVERISPSPLISSIVSIRFAFGEAVLFENTSVPQLYTNVTLDPSATFFQASTYFATSTVPMSNIFSPDLRADLSLAFDGTSKAYLRGTPTFPASNTYTIRAVNSNGTARDFSTGISVVDDFVTFSSSTPAPGTSYNFVISRPLDLSLTGYYPTPIQFSAAAASGSSLSWSAPALAGTGLSLSTSGNTATITGTPTKITPLQTLAVTASAVSTPATNTRNVNFAVIDDVFTFPTIATLSWIQNKAITPVQITVTTLSGRQVVSYSASGLPSGVSITPNGLLTGTPATSTTGITSFTITASTGYTSGSSSFSFTTTPDSILFLTTPTSYSYEPASSVLMDINAFAYSGKTVSNFMFSNFTPSYGLSINSSNGIITGTLGDGVPPNPLLPSLKYFDVKASVGTVTGALTAQMATDKPIVNRSFIISHAEFSSQLYFTDTDALNDWTLDTSVVGGTFTDFQVKNTTLDSNTFLICESSGGGGSSYVWRRGEVGSNGMEFARASFGDDSAYKAINISNTSTWYIAGTTYVDDVDKVTLFKSLDDGVTWNVVANNLEMASRQVMSTPNYYTSKGVAFGYSNGTFVLGGGSNASLISGIVMARSTDGINWSAPISGGFELEVGNFSMDGPVWVATGSTDYTMGGSYSGSFPTVAKTLQWSSDGGRTWNPATGDFDFAGVDVAYASNTWLATGMSRNGTGTAILSELRCSTDGMAWSNVTLPITFTSFSGAHLPEINTIWFDGSKWNAMVKKDDTTTPDYSCYVYTHDLSSSLTSGWALLSADGAVPFMGDYLVSLSSYKRQYIRTGTPTTVTFTFNTISPNGPVFTSPTKSSYLFYQYVPITPVVFTATGTGTVYFFIDEAELPDGIQFDTLTGTLSGTSVQLGNKSFNIYAKDDNGVRLFTLGTTTILASVTRQQDGAGAWTSLVRQYTEVNAATTSRDNKATPAIDYRLGEFTSPEPPNVTTADFDCPR